MKKILMCPPDHFSIKYEINPWMHIENKVNPLKAKEEFFKLKSVYQDLNVNILEIPQNKNPPDMVYAANFGFPKNNFFIKSNFKFKERKKESHLSKIYFEKLGFKIKELPQDIKFEGQGDLLTNGKSYFFGWGKRSDFKAKKYLADFLEQEIIDFKLIDPYYYHLDTCFAPIDKKTVVVNPNAFEKKDIDKINKLFQNVISVSKNDNKLFACNLVVTGKTIVIGKGISNKLKEDFKRYGFTAIETPTSEFIKGGGSVKCLTLEFY